MECNTQMLCDIFEIDPSTLATWLKASMPREALRPGRHGGSVYNTRKVIDWFALREKKRTVLGDEDGELYDWQVEKGRLTHHQANKEAMIEAQLRGELIAAADVERTWSSAILAMRAKMLAIPSKLAKIAINAESVKEIERMADKLLDEAMNELAIYRYESEAIASESPEAGEVSTEADSEPVGRPVPKTKRGGKRGARAVANG